MSARPLVGVLALQGDVAEHVAALASAGADARRVRRPGDLAGLAAIVLPGGESTTIDKLARAFEVRDPLVAALRSGLPAFGSCAGMILLADRIIDGTADQQTFGGLDATVRRNAFGRQVASFDTAIEVRGMPGPPLPASFIRAPWVEEVGTTVQVLATVDVPGHGPKIVAVRQNALLATAFHPEITGDHRLHALFVSMLRDA